MPKTQANRTFQRNSAEIGALPPISALLCRPYPQELWVSGTVLSQRGRFSRSSGVQQLDTIPLIIIYNRLEGVTALVGPTQRSPLRGRPLPEAGGVGDRQRINWDVLARRRRQKARRGRAVVSSRASHQSWSSLPESKSAVLVRIRHYALAIPSTPLRHSSSVTNQGVYTQECTMASIHKSRVD